MSEIIVNDYLGRINLSLNADYAIESHILRHGVWEENVVGLFSYFARQGNTCIDVGANTGIHLTLLASLVGEDGHVYGFEPSADYTSRIKANLELNPNFTNRVTLFSKGASDHVGTLKWFESGELSGNAYMAEEYDNTLWNKNDPTVFTVCPITTIDQELAGVRVDLMKVDVEGMESKVFKGAEQTIKSNSPFLIYETLIKDFGPEKTKETDDLVRSYGYYTYYISPKLGKLISCKYPNFPADVIAIHPKRMLMAAPIIHNCVRYDVNNFNPVEFKNDSLELTIVGLNSGIYVACLSCKGDESQPMQIVPVKADNIFAFTQMFNDMEISFSAVIQEVTEGLMDLLDVTLKIPQAGVSYQISLSKQGGILYDFEKLT